MTDGPIAPYDVRATVCQRTDAWRMSLVSKSASSGCTSTRIASLKPMRANALFHSRMPSRIGVRYFSGMLRSSQ
jgi:hypothetical protein